MKRHQVLVWLLVVGAFLAMACRDSFGRVWSVAQDGSGDFTVIQHAVDAAEDGDVIEIGPGHYTDYSIISGLGHVYVYLDGTKSLTFVGAGREGTTIGPVSYTTNANRFGIYCTTGPASVRIEQLRIKNFNTIGIWLANALVEIDDIVVEMARRGIYLRPTNDQVVIANSLLLNGEVLEGDLGMVCGAPRAEIRDTVFYGLQVGLDINNPGSTEVLVDRCEFIGAGAGVVGIQFTFGAGGTVQNCRISGFRNYGFVPGGAGTVTFRHNVIEDSYYFGIGLEGVENVTIHDNIVTRCGTAIYIASRPVSHSIYNNHFIRYPEAEEYQRGYYVRTPSGYPYGPYYFDFTNNYWGTTDPEEISTWIYDGYDNPNVWLYVIFEPMADGPVPVQQQTWSEVKGLFRN